MAVSKAAVKRIAASTREAAGTGVSYGRAGAGSVVETVQGRERGSLGLMIVGWTLLLILVYVLVADKPVVNSLGGLSNVGGGVVKAWVEPVDPISTFTSSLGLSSSQAASTSPSPGGRTGVTSTPAGYVPGRPAPSPATIARSPIQALRRQYGTGTGLDAQLRARRIREGVLHA